MEEKIQSFLIPRYKNYLKMDYKTNVETKSLSVLSENKRHCLRFKVLGLKNKSKSLGADERSQIFNQSLRSNSLLLTIVLTMRKRKSLYKHPQKTRTHSQHLQLHSKQTSMFYKNPEIRNGHMESPLRAWVDTD